SLLVGVLDAAADLDEEIEPRAHVEPLRVAIVDHPGTVDVLHDEVRVAAERAAGVEDLRDAPVAHQGERLTLRLEAGEHLRAVETGPEPLQGDAASDRLLLLRLPDDPHAALAEDPEEEVGSDPLAGDVVGAGRPRRGKGLRLPVPGPGNRERQLEGAPEADGL